MYTLFYSPGSMSLAAHIGLRELGVEFELRRFATADGANRTPEYLAINPTGFLPALRLPSGDVLTENIAILSYLAGGSGSSLLPEDRLARARVLERMSFVASAAHPPFTLMFAPARWGFADDILPAIKGASRTRFAAMLAHLEAAHVGPFALPTFSIADCQLFVAGAVGCISADSARRAARLAKPGARDGRAAFGASGPAS